MTPEKAKQLLDAATPGPWKRHPDKPRALCNLERKFAVHMELAKDRGLDPHPEDVANTELIAAAPALAETVAGLRGEYAVQLAECNNAFVKRFKNGKLGSGPAMHAEWCATFSQAENLENDFAHQFPSAPRTFIVARYVSAEPWEVIA